MTTVSLDSFYQRMATAAQVGPETLRPAGPGPANGHFNVFNVGELFRDYPELPPMPYDRRSYYKISLIRGRSRAEYANKVVDIEGPALLFATPRVPYYWRPQEAAQAGHFCVFTSEFLRPAHGGSLLDELSLFQAGGCSVFEVTEADWAELNAVFGKMEREIHSDYRFKYDLLRTYVLELIHRGQKLQPLPARPPEPTAAARVTALFVELLERQFPVDSLAPRPALRTASDYADRLAVHVNHLNKVLKETTGHTTTELISRRVAQEARHLLRHTDWTISQIADRLGFAEVAHFSRFFKQQTAQAPSSFRR